MMNFGKISEHPETSQKDFKVILGKFQKNVKHSKKIEFLWNLLIRGVIKKFCDTTLYVCSGNTEATA